MSRLFTIAAIQMRSGITPARNIDDLAPLVADAAARGAQLVSTPEMTTCLERNAHRRFDNAARDENDSAIQAVAAMARKHKIWLHLGSAAFASAPIKIFNRGLVFSPEGQITARYDKIHLFDVDLGAEKYRESDYIEWGTEAVVANLDGPKLGLSICYDLRFAALYRKLAQSGAEILAVPAAFTRPTGEAHWEVLLRARAIETGSFVIAAAQGGTHEDGRSTWGHSMIVDPWGKVLAEAADDAPGVIVAQIDLDQAAEARRKVPAFNLERTFTGP
ncbi:MAG: carbon-nitrogen hydrolase family protein [Caulobacterales bacterium]